MLRVGRNWVTHLEFPQLFLWNWNFLNCPWWAVNSLSVPFPFPHINNWPVQVDWKPNVLGPVRSRFPFQNTRPFNVTQNSWFHLSHANMDLQGEEPKSKRRKFTEEDPSKNNNSRSSSRASTPNREELRVPSPLESCNSHASSTGENEDGNLVQEGNRFRCKAAIVQRHWEDFCHHYKENTNDTGNECLHQEQSATAEKFDFSVMSYNILSQDLLEDNSHLYRHCRQPILFWSYRLPNILRELRELNADVLCLQEVQEDHYIAQIKPSLEALGYMCEYKMRTGSKPDGCAICFKASKFSLVSANPVEFYRCDISLLDRDNVGLVLLLQPKTCPHSPSICVANTHLLYNPRRGDIKLTQLAILLAEIAGVALQEDGRFCPIILCGDFNSVPGSPLHSFIKEGWLDYEGLTIGRVSGQEFSPRGQRPLSIPIWPERLGISHSCLYEQTQKHKTEPLEKEVEEEMPKEPEKETSEDGMAKEPEKETSEDKMLKEPEKETSEVEMLKEPEKETSEVEMLKEPEKETSEYEMLKEPEKETSEYEMLKEPEKETSEYEMLKEPEKETSEYEMLKEPEKETSEYEMLKEPEQKNYEDFEAKSQLVDPAQTINSSLQHSFSLSSVYSHFVPETGIPEVTTCHSRTAVTVDYIFYSAAQSDVSLPPGTTVEGKGLKLLGRLSLLTEDDLWTVNGLPNETISSDHLSLVARFRLEL